MNISTKIVDDCLIVRLHGELDMHSVPDFKEKVIKLMKKNKLNNLLLNLKGVNFIDSSGLGAILGRYRDLDNKGGKVILVKIKPQVKKVFTLAGMLKIMSEYNDESVALKALNEGGFNLV